MAEGRKRGVVVERNSVVSEVKIPLIFIIEILIGTIQILSTTPLYCESMVFAPVEATS